MPDFDAEAADMIEAAAESDGWIPPSHASNLADSIACLLQEVYDLGRKPNADFAALRRMLADEQAAHAETRQELKTERWNAGNLRGAWNESDSQHKHELLSLQVDYEAWMSLAIQRMRQYERAARWAQRWKASAKETRKANIINRRLSGLIVAEAEVRLVRNRTAWRKAVVKWRTTALAADQRLTAALALLADIAKDTLAPAHAARYAALLAQEGQG